MLLRPRVLFLVVACWREATTAGSVVTKLHGGRGRRWCCPHAVLTFASRRVLLRGGDEEQEPHMSGTRQGYELEEKS
jgi:hypothetical protein